MQAIAKDYDLMLECMVNHISPASEQFQDFLEKGDTSEHASMFIDWQKFWGEGAASFSAPATHNIYPCIGLLFHQGLQSCKEWHPLHAATPKQRC